MLSRTVSSGCKSLRKFRNLRHFPNRRYTEKSMKDDNPKSELSDESLRITEMLKNAANFNETKDTSWSTTPYPNDAPSTPPEDEIIERTKVEPLDTSILVFPGQGTLRVGNIAQYMKFPRVKELYENANEALGYDLAKLCLSGPQERLDRTEFNQPATVVASLAALERLWEERPLAIESCKAAAGYSVGEITALIFSGAMSIEAGIRLAGVRGAAMQKAADETPQGMLAVYCSATSKVPEACKDAEKWVLELGVNTPVCRTAVYLYTQGKIIAGNEEALRFLETNKEKYDLRGLRRIPVSGAFHTILMEPALKPFMKALGSIHLEEPRIKVYSNVSVQPYRSIRDIKKLLPRQIISAVKWEQVMHKLYERPPGTGFPRTFDLGSNGYMKSILKKINAKAWDHCYNL